MPLFKLGRTPMESNYLGKERCEKLEKNGKKVENYPL
jgi:hypothetical protein